MSALPITALYGAACGVILVALSLLITLERGRHRVEIGDGGHARLARLMRAQANFAEYVPLALLLILLVEASGWPAWVVHALGIVLVASRITHPVAFVRRVGASPGRAAGTAGTWGVILAAAALCAVSGFRPLVEG